MSYKNEDSENMINAFKFSVENYNGKIGTPYIIGNNKKS